ASMTRAALYRHVAAKKPCKLTRDRQPETGTARVFLSRRLPLPERLEQVLRILRADAHAGVGDAKDQRLLLHLEIEPHLTLLRELHGVGREVEYNLAKLPRVGGKYDRCRRKVKGELEFLRRRHGREQRDGVAQESRQIDVLPMHLAMARIHLRDGQNLLDETQKMQAGRVDALELLPLPVGDRPGDLVHQEVYVTANDTERRPELVRHRRQEGRLRLVGRLRLLPCGVGSRSERLGSPRRVCGVFARRFRARRSLLGLGARLMRLAKEPRVVERHAAPSAEVLSQKE